MAATQRRDGPRPAPQQGARRAQCGDSGVSNRGAKDTKSKGRTAFPWRCLHDSSREGKRGGGVHGREGRASRAGPGDPDRLRKGASHTAGRAPKSAFAAGVQRASLSESAVPGFRWLDLQFFHFAIVKSDGNPVETTPPVSNSVFSQAGHMVRHPPVTLGSAGAAAPLAPEGVSAQMDNPAPCSLVARAEPDACRLGGHRHARLTTGGPVSRGASVIMVTPPRNEAQGHRAYSAKVCIKSCT